MKKLYWSILNIFFGKKFDRLVFIFYFFDWIFVCRYLNNNFVVSKIVKLYVIFFFLVLLFCVFDDFGWFVGLLFRLSCIVDGFLNKYICIFEWKINFVIILNIYWLVLVILCVVFGFDLL